MDLDTKWTLIQNGHQSKMNLNTTWDSIQHGTQYKNPWPDRPGQGVHGPGGKWRGRRTLGPLIQATAVYRDEFAVTT